MLLFLANQIRLYQFNWHVYIIMIRLRHHVDHHQELNFIKNKIISLEKSTVSVIENENTTAFVLMYLYLILLSTVTFFSFC